MALNDNAAELFKGFSKLNFKERLKKLQAMGALSDTDCQRLLDANKLPVDLAENLIENVIGYFQIPLGVATNLRIDNQDYVIPMAVEETSIIAAVSKTARWVRDNGKIETRIIGTDGIGQIQLAKLKQTSDTFKTIIERNKDYLINKANQEAAASLVKRGGGVNDISVKFIKRPDTQYMAVIHVYVNTCDAMGANMITQICEFLKPHIEQLSNESVTMCILSNLSDSKLVEATITINNIAPETGEGIQEASIFAESDPHRAATHNKGILNGIDPILIATGNDWRAVEAGMHAYACRDGMYRSMSEWRYHDGQLIGKLITPIAVGTVGGMTKLHPYARLSLNMMGIESSDHLARIIAAVGLTQNLGAIKALTTVGLIEGHMKLHIKNLSLSAGATTDEQPILQGKLQQLLNLTNRVTLTNALELLSEIRKELTPSKKSEETLV